MATTVACSYGAVLYIRRLQSYRPGEATWDVLLLLKGSHLGESQCRRLIAPHVLRVFSFRFLHRFRALAVYFLLFVVLVVRFELLLFNASLNFIYLAWL